MPIGNTLTMNVIVALYLIHGGRFNKETEMGHIDGLSLPLNIWKPSVQIWMPIFLSSCDINGSDSMMSFQAFVWKTSQEPPLPRYSVGSPCLNCLYWRSFAPFFVLYKALKVSTRLKWCRCPAFAFGSPQHGQLSRSLDSQWKIWPHNFVRQTL